MPEISIENVSVNENDVTISWDTPDSVNLTFFSYRYNYNNSFYLVQTDWQDIGENIQYFTFDNLYDGNYHVEILGRYYDEHEDSAAVASTDFNLDFLQNYSLSLFPSEQTIQVNDKVEIFLTIPRIDNIFGYQIDLLYESDMLGISEEDIGEGNLIESFPGSVFLPEIIDNLIRIHILTVEGNNPLNEDGALAKLQFAAKTTGTTDIILSNSSTLRDIDNNEIAIDTLYNCSVTILQ